MYVTVCVCVCVSVCLTCTYPCAPNNKKIADCRKGASHAPTFVGFVSAHGSDCEECEQEAFGGRVFGLCVMISLGCLGPLAGLPDQDSTRIPSSSNLTTNNQYREFKKRRKKKFKKEENQETTRKISTTTT